MPVGAVGSPLPSSVSPVGECDPVISPCWSIEPSTAILAVASHVLVSVWIHGPLANAPPPLKFVMQEKTLPFSAPVVEYWLSPNGSFVRSTPPVLDAAEAPADVADGVFASLLHAATAARAPKNVMTIDLRRT